MKVSSATAAGTPSLCFSSACLLKIQQGQKAPRKGKTGCAAQNRTWVCAAQGLLSAAVEEGRERDALTPAPLASRTSDTMA